MPLVIGGACFLVSASDGDGGTLDGFYQTDVTQGEGAARAPHALDDPDGTGADAGGCPSADRPGLGIPAVTTVVADTFLDTPVVLATTAQEFLGPAQSTSGRRPPNMQEIRAALNIQTH